MEALIILIPLSVILIAIAALIFLNQSHKGQFDDLDTPSRTVLLDDDRGRDESDPG